MRMSSSSVMLYFLWSCNIRSPFSQDLSYWCLRSQTYASSLLKMGSFTSKDSKNVKDGKTLYRIILYDLSEQYSARNCFAITACPMWYSKSLLTPYSVRVNTRLTTRHLDFVFKDLRNKETKKTGIQDSPQTILKFWRFDGIVSKTHNFLTSYHISANPIHEFSYVNNVQSNLK